MEEKLTVQAVVEEKGFGEESLLPQENRIMGNLSYLFAWIGGCVFIGYFMLGASLVPPVGKLNLLQAFVCMIVSMTIVSFCFTLNGQAGHKYGIPFIIQARSAFGIQGSKLPGVIRAVPAIFWYGVQTWVGGLALNAISVELFSFDSPMFWFVTFQLFQILLSILGFKGIKWLENIGAVIIMISLCWMLYIIYAAYGSQVQEKIINIPGTWGLAFWGGTTAFIGIYTTLMLNISDYTREFNKSSTTKLMFILHIVGTLPTTLFMAVIGLLAAGVTGQWDPIHLFVELLPNKLVLVAALFFVVLAQITTNIMLNVVPPTYVMMDLFGIDWKKGSVITGLLAFLTFPWKIATAGGFFLFIQIYSVFLGPIFAVLVVDYYFFRKQQLDLNVLYDVNGPYKSVNWAGIIAIVIGAIFGAIEVQLSWYISLIPAGLSYYLMMKYGIAKNYLPQYSEKISA
ncbi:MAG: transporter [Peptococcaceae bacterium BICA1-8]|nr:MAG: transporter [Peptococcaceae bacterium BICA1-8]